MSPNPKHTELVGRALRMIELALSAFLVPQRVRLGSAAYQACNPRQMEQRLAVEWHQMVEVVPDSQLLPDEIVLDMERRSGGFDEDLLNILAKRVGDKIEEESEDDPFDVVPTCRGNRPAFRGKN